MPFRNAAAVVAAAATTATTAAALPVPENVTYQGHLEDRNGPVTGTADLRVNVIAPGDGVVDTQTFNAVAFDEGNFTIQLNFRVDLMGLSTSDFDGRDYELEFCVRDRAGSFEPFVCLAPTQPLSTTPYAFHANTADDLRAPAAVIGTPIDQPALLINPNNGAIDPFILAREYPLLVTTGDVDTLFPMNGTAVRVSALSESAAIYATGGTVGVQGISSNTSTGFSAGIFGAVRPFPSVDTSQHVGVRAAAAGGTVSLGTSTHAAEFNGDLRIDNGAVSRAYAPNTQDLIHPIAYGFINSTGTVASGTPNVAAVWNPTFNWYEITIDNESYLFSAYSTVITTTASGAIPRTSSTSGRLIVQIINSSNGTPRQAPFNFVTYKPDGAAELQGRRRPALQPLTNPVLDSEALPELTLPARTPTPARTVPDLGVTVAD